MRYKIDGYPKYVVNELSKIGILGSSKREVIDHIVGQHLFYNTASGTSNERMETLLRTGTYGTDLCEVPQSIMLRWIDENTEKLKSQRITPEDVRKKRYIK